VHKENKPASKPKIFHLITRFLQGGGAEAKTLAELAALRHKYAFTLGYGAEFSPTQLARVTELGISMQHFGLIRHYDPVSLMLACLQVYRYLKSRNFDIVHTHSTEAGIVGRIAARWAGTPVIVHTIHGIPFTGQRNLFLRSFLLCMDRLAASWTTRLIANADVIRSAYLKAGVGHSEQIVTIRSGVDLERFANALPMDLSLPAESFRVLSVARLTKGKGFRELLEAATQLIREHPKVVFFIAGEGSLRAKLEAEIKRRKLTSWVRLLGYQSDLASLMKAVDLFVLPSYREGTPRVISEAMAAGLPVVSTRIDGIPEQVEHGVNGLLVEPRQVRPLVEAILELALDEGLCRRMGEAGRKRAEAYSMDTMVAAIDQLYQELLFQHFGLKH